MSGSTQEIRRLQQDLLQRRSSVNIFEPKNIDRIRLLETQLLAGKVPVSKKLLKEQKKKKKKAKKKKKLRGDLAANLRAQRRFVKGEFREKDTEEPRIVDDASGRNINLNIPGLAEALARGLAPPPVARRVQRRGSAPDLRPGLRALGDDGRGRSPRGRVERDVDDPLAAEVERQRRAHDDFRGQVEGFARGIDERDAAYRAEQRAQYEDRDEYLRQQRARDDAQYADLEERFGNQATSLAEARERVEALEARERARLQPGDDRPTDYDSVLIDAADDSFRDFDVEEFERSAREGLGLSGTTTPIRSPGLSLVEATPQAGERVEDISEIADEWASSYRQAQEASSNRVDEGYIESVQRHILGGGDPPDTLRPPRRLDRSPGGPRRDPDNPFFAQQPSPFSSPARPNTPETPDRSGGSLSPEPARIGGGGELDLPAVEIGDVSQLSTGLDPAEALPVSRSAERAQERIEAGAALPGDEERFRLTTTQEPGFPEFERPEEQEERVLAETFPGGFAPSADPASPSSPVPVVVAQQRVIEPEGVQAIEQPARELEPERTIAPKPVEEEEEEEEEVGQVLDAGQQRIRDSQTLFQQSKEELLGNVRPGRTQTTGRRGGLGYRVRNNSKKPVKKIQPGDVQNIIGVEGGTDRDPSPKYKLDTGVPTQGRTKVSQLQPRIDSGELLFEKGHRHELGGHFDEQPYGPPPVGGQTVGELAAEVEARVPEPEPASGTEAVEPEIEPAAELVEAGGDE